MAFTELSRRASRIVLDRSSDWMPSELEPSISPAAYITAILVVGIDEEVPDTEQDYISELQEALRISDERAQELIDEIFGEEEE